MELTLKFDKRNRLNEINIPNLDYHIKWKLRYNEVIEYWDSDGNWYSKELMGGECPFFNWNNFRKNISKLSFMYFGIRSNRLRVDYQIALNILPQAGKIKYPYCFSGSDEFRNLCHLLANNLTFSNTK